MRVKLHQDLEKYRGTLVPTIKTLADLVRALKVILPELVMIQVFSNCRCCYHLTTNTLSIAQWAMTNLVIGRPGTRNIAYNDHMELQRFYSTRLYPPKGTGAKLYKFMNYIPDSIWINWTLVRTVAHDARQEFVFYMPAEGYDGYRIRDNTTFNVSCSGITVTTKII